MSRMKSAGGVMRTFMSLTKEEWNVMDKKFYRIVGGIAGFAVMALFWFYFLRNIGPF